MVTKKIIQYLAAVALIFGSASCKKDFGDLNVDPTQPSYGELKTRFLLAEAENGLNGTVFGNNTGNFYVQYLSEGPYPGASLYSGRNFDWAGFYTGPMYNLQRILDLIAADDPAVDEGSNGAIANQKAVAEILQSYFFVFMTDRWGPIPFTSALKGGDDLAPAYSSQEEVYTATFATLAAAVSAIDESQAGVTGDILLGGDMLWWKKFANTLRLHMAMNMSKVNAATAATEFNNALNASGGVLESNSENIEWTYLTDLNYINPWYNNYTIGNRNDFAISNTLGDFMLDTDDPRISNYAELLPTGYKPLSYGSASARNIPLAYSRIGDYFRGATSPARIYNYPQILFMKAEAAQRGWIEGSAADFYKEAIEASWEMNEVGSASELSAFLADPQVAFSAANAIERIITQKWVHNYLNGYSAWNDWRRTGFPELTAADGAVDTRGIPLRQGYPPTEPSLNADSYEAGVSLLGGDDDNYTELWLYK